VTSDAVPDVVGEERHEFCSAGWVDCVRALIGESLAELDLSGVTMSFSEELTDPPAHLLTPDRSSVGWHYRIDDGTLTVEGQPMHDADLRMIGDYDTIVVLARLPYADPEIGPLATAALNTGTMRYEGSSEGGDRRVLKAMQALHDNLVPLTA
jgi:hypothetical protein